MESGRTGSSSSCPSRARNGAEGEHGILQGTFVVGQGRFGIQHVQLQLEQVVFADLSHAAFDLGHFVQLAGIFQVLAGDVYPFACQQQIEEWLMVFSVTFSVALRKAALASS